MQTKQCSQCGEEKPVAEYQTITAQGRPYTQRQCSDCMQYRPTRRTPAVDTKTYKQYLAEELKRTDPLVIAMNR